MGLKRVREQVVRLAGGIWQGLFPRRLELSQEHTRLLEIIFPKVALRRVRYQVGMPWFMFRLKRVKAITLPTTYGFTGVTVRFRSFEPYDPFYMALLVHETVHLKQIQKTWGGIGLGMFRPFLGRYLAEHFNSSYFENPMEKDAYDFDGAFESYCRQLKRQFTRDDEAFMNEVIGQYPEHLKDPKELHERKANAFQLIAGFALAFGMAILRPVAELLLLLGCGLLWIFAGLLWLITWR